MYKRQVGQLSREVIEHAPIIAPSPGVRTRNDGLPAGRVADVSEPAERAVVYTDGACRGNPGPGGWGWVVPDGPWANGFDPDTTNQRMELLAVLDALRTIEGPVEVVSDSTYVVNCFRDGWWKGWLKRDWKNSKKEPVANRDLWEPLICLLYTSPSPRDA